MRRLPPQIYEALMVPLALAVIKVGGSWWEVWRILGSLGPEMAEILSRYEAMIYEGHRPEAVLMLASYEHKLTTVYSLLRAVCSSRNLESLDSYKLYSQAFLRIKSKLNNYMRHATIIITIAISLGYILPVVFSVTMVLKGPNYSMFLLPLLAIPPLLKRVLERRWGYGS